MSNEQLQLEQLSIVLSVLSSAHLEQVRQFPDFVNAADELALAFDDVWQYCPSLLKSGKIAADSYNLIVHVNSALDAMSEDQSQWCNDALGTSTNWDEVRHLASRAHSALGISTEKSTIDWIHFEQ